MVSLEKMLEVCEVDGHEKAVIQCKRILREQHGDSKRQNFQEALDRKAVSFGKNRKGVVEW